MADRTDQLSAEHELLLLWIEDELNPEQTAAFEQVLAERDDLAELAARLRADRAGLKQLPDLDPPHDLADVAIERLERNLLLDDTPSRRSPRTPRQTWGRPLAYAAAAGIGLVCGGVLWQSLTTGSSLIDSFKLPIEQQVAIAPTATKSAIDSDEASDMSDEALPSSSSMKRVVIAEAEATPAADSRNLTPEERLQRRAERLRSPDATANQSMQLDSQPASAVATNPIDELLIEKAEQLDSTDTPNALAATGVPARQLAGMGGIVPMTPASRVPPETLTLTNERPERMVTLIEQWAGRRALPVQRVSVINRPEMVQPLFTRRAFIPPVTTSYRSPTGPVDAEQAITLTITGPPEALSALRDRLSPRPVEADSKPSPAPAAFQSAHDAQPATLTDLLRALQLPEQLRSLIPVEEGVAVRDLGQPPSQLTIIIRPAQQQPTPVTQPDSNPQAENNSNGDANPAGAGTLSIPTTIDTTPVEPPPPADGEPGDEAQEPESEPGQQP
ncbi:MAG: hypothetical protein RIG82_00540 [Phycisphaeraceae bacterium]